MKGDTVNECVNETVSSMWHLNHSQLCQGRIALTQSVPFLRCREHYPLSPSVPNTNYCVSAALFPEHSMRPVLEFLLFCVCRMLAFFLQWSWLSWQEFRCHTDQLGSAVVLETGTNCKGLQGHLEHIVLEKLDWTEWNFGCKLTSNAETITARCSDFLHWGRHRDIFPVYLITSIRMEEEGCGPDKENRLHLAS